MSRLWDRRGTLDTCTTRSMLIVGVAGSVVASASRHVWRATFGAACVLTWHDLAYDELPNDQWIQPVRLSDSGRHLRFATEQGVRDRIVSTPYTAGTTRTGSYGNGANARVSLGHQEKLEVLYKCPLLIQRRRPGRLAVG